MSLEMLQGNERASSWVCLLLPFPAGQHKLGCMCQWFMAPRNKRRIILLSKSGNPSSETDSQLFDTRITRHLSDPAYKTITSDGKTHPTSPLTMSWTAHMRSRGRGVCRCYMDMEKCGTAASEKGVCSARFRLPDFSCCETAAAAVAQNETHSNP